MTVLRDAFRNEQVIAEVTASRFGVQMPESMARRACKALRSWLRKNPQPTEPQSNSYVLSRIKSFLMDEGAFDLPFKCGVEWETHSTAQLHVFFLSLEENDKHLARLRGEKGKGKVRVARSKVHRTQQKISPIDKVACRISPKELRKPEST